MFYRRADEWNDSVSKNAPWTSEACSLPVPIIDCRASREDNIRQLAYFKWEQGGKPEGMSELFWFQAEQEYARQLAEQSVPSPAGRLWTAFSVWVSRCRAWRFPRLTPAWDSSLARAG